MIGPKNAGIHPSGVPFDGVDVLDSDTAVGCEFASIFTALGAEVTLVDSRERLLPFMDAEIAKELATTFRSMGMSVVPGAGPVTAKPTASGVQVDLAGGEAVEAEKVIFATGRVGDTEDLGLEDADVETDDRGRILVDDHYRTTAEGIYAAGDVIGPPALASVSMEQAREAARWAFDLPLKRAEMRSAPYGVYSVPEVAMVGLTEEAAAEQGIDHAVGRAGFDANTRAAISGATDGMLKLVFARDTLRVLGVHVLGDGATELVHQGQAVIHFGATIEYFVHSTFNVPTMSEAYKYAAYDGLRASGR